jgi:hypothetical protein
MEPDEFECRLSEQDNKCGLCRVEFTEEHNIYVDHDHVTKKNRSLLCPRCNTAVGVFDRLSWDEVLLYWGYAKFHGEGIDLAKLLGGSGEYFPDQEDA